MASFYGNPQDNNPYTENELAILQRYSINDILKNDTLWNSQYGQRNDKTMSEISDLLGLHSPRGQLNVGSSDYCTPPPSPHNRSMNDGFPTMKDTATGLIYMESQKNDAHSGFPAMRDNSSGGFKSLQRNVSLGSVGSSPARRSASRSDSCSSSSPAHFDQSQLLNRSLSRSDTPDYACFTPSTPVPDLTDLLCSLSLNDVMQAKRSPDTNMQSLRLLNTILSPVVQNGQMFDWSNAIRNNPLPENIQLERAARLHRSAAAVCDAVCTWSGALPEKTIASNEYSSQVFVGGLPWDMTEQCLIQAFRQFGSVKVDWPGKDNNVENPKGYAFVAFESEKRVKDLLKVCFSNSSKGNCLFYRIGSKRLRSKDVQIIPWHVCDSNYTKCSSQKLDPNKTVYVGALHGMLTAQALAKIMNDLFDGVIYAGIDTDKYKYPIGSGRVTFNNEKSFLKAITTAFVDIKTDKFSKKVQVDPYLEDALCSVCGLHPGPYFCKDFVCFRYFCFSCWFYRHESNLNHHLPMSRNSKKNTLRSMKKMGSSYTCK